MKYIIVPKSTEIIKSDGCEKISSHTILEINNDEIKDIKFDKEKFKKAIKYYIKNGSSKSQYNLINIISSLDNEYEDEYIEYLFDILYKENKILHSTKLAEYIPVEYFKFIFKKFTYNNIESEFGKLVYLKSIFVSYLETDRFLIKDRTDKEKEELKVLLYDKFIKYIIKDLDEDNKKFLMEESLNILASSSITNYLNKRENILTSILNFNWNNYNSFNYDKKFPIKILNLVINLIKTNKFKPLSSVIYSDKYEEFYLPSLSSYRYSETVEEENKFVEFVAYDLVNTEKLSSVKYKYNKCKDYTFTNEEMEMLDKIILDKFPTTVAGKFIIDNQL